MNKRLKRWLKKREKTLTKYRWLIIAVAIIAGLFILFYSAKFFLFLNFLLGNDIVVKLDASEEDVFLLNNEQRLVTFTSSVITNPFCKAQCVGTFTDINTGKERDEQLFTLKPSNPYEQQYTLHAPRNGHGQLLYRYSMTCESVQTVLCHTDGEPTTRSILLTLSHELTEEQKALQTRLGNELQILQGRLATVFQSITTAQAVTNHADTLTLPKIEEAQANAADKELIRINKLWQQEKYEEINTETVTSNIASLESDTTLNSIVPTIQRYNDILARFPKTQEQQTINRTLATAMNDTVQEHNSAVQFFEKRTTIEEKLQAENLATHATQTNENLTKLSERDTLRLALQLDILQDAACFVGTCVPHENASVRSKEIPRVAATCARIPELKTVLNTTGTTSTNELLQHATNNYLDALPEGKNTQIIKELLTKQAINLTNATNTSLLAGLGNNIPECTIYTTKTPQQLSVQPILIPPPVPISFPRTFTPPNATCCVFGECSSCCDDCENQNYPIILLHGHAFNRDTLADYSLEAFNGIQDRLEEDGFLDAGTISLYTKVDSPPGVRGRMPVPLSIKASYYFDIFQEPENYIVVQTKSENVDTYAVRLKDLIDTVRQKTGKQKVIVLAHSMGGLVTRRYIQIFGSEHVDKLIMIGTPNHGITGSIADYCSLLGERLECRDMHESSLLLNKLSQQSLDIPVHNIIGSGCVMDDGLGDGTVLEDHAFLEGAQNYVIKGTCTTLEPLHTELLDMEKYPEVYETITSALASS